LLHLLQLLVLLVVMLMIWLCSASTPSPHQAATA
jgi:hypothetical protein